MGDSNYYPDRWKEYVSTIKKNGGWPTTEWGTCAARYRVAGNYAGVNFFKMSGPVANGYDRAIQLLLSYSAFESACTATGVKPYDRPIPSDFGVAKSARQGVVKAFGRIPESAFPLRAGLVSEKLVLKVDAFFRGEDNNLQPVSSALRHAFAHGIWTPTGAKNLTATACNALSLLSQSLLREVDRLLEEELFRVQSSSASEG
jgi:hypothetical protein